MNKVWILWMHDSRRGEDFFEDDDFDAICGIYSSREKAEAAKNNVQWITEEDVL